MDNARGAVRGLTALFSTTALFLIMVVAAHGQGISGVSPNPAAVGTLVTITGSGFGASQGNSTVAFNGTAATPSTWSDGRIDVPVPNGATTGNVTVTVGGVPSTAPFTVAPAITSLSPGTAAVGTSVTLTGTSFGSAQGSSTVTFNGTTATPTSWSGTSIAVPVPSGATTGNVVVTVGGVGSNGAAFTVAPGITSLSPSTGPVGTSVTIAGTSFGSSQGSSTVTFNGTATIPTSWSGTSIAAPVPTGATTGNVVVTVGGIASNGAAFTVAPAITGLSPTKAAVGTSITITGTSFGSAQGNSTVTFNGTAAAPTSWSGTSIAAPVPTGATTGNVVVTVGGIASNGAAFTVDLPPVVSLTSPPNGFTATLPVDVTLAANASDPDGTVTKVEFFAGTTSLAQVTSSPYQFVWRNVHSGTYTLTAKATDDSGSVTTSSPVTITINPRPIPPPACPTQGSGGGQYFIPQSLGDSITFTLDLAPCEIIEAGEWRVDLNHVNASTMVQMQYFNYLGDSIFSQEFNGATIPAQAYIFPSWYDRQDPWRGVRGPEQLPAYLTVTAAEIFHTESDCTALDPCPKYWVWYGRSPRQGYNTGGVDFNSPPYFTPPATFYGSELPKEINGQVFKVHLQPGASFHISGTLLGSSSYGPYVHASLYDATQKLINYYWINVADYGFNTFTSSVFTNGSSAADYFVQLQCQLYALWDFRIDFSTDPFVCPEMPGSSAPAPDATATGPLAVATPAEYRLPAAVDNDVLANDNKVAPLVNDPSGQITGRETEEWARVYRPASLTAGPYPLIIMLAGNHGTCGDPSVTPRNDNVTVSYFDYYTTTGKCPDGQVVVDTQEGYDYLGQQLASWGYIVVSINANRGINRAPETLVVNGVPTDFFPDGDPKYILARARLVLKHLQYLSQWNQNGGTPASLGVELKGKLDFGNVGFFGHSRGGEGVRVAYSIYTVATTQESIKWNTQILSPLTIKAVFEAGPTDYTQSIATGTKWNVLLPMCDGDVVTLEGVNPFDRMLLPNASFPPDGSTSQKSTYTVWGANHNYYNTQWQQNESLGCIGSGNKPLFSGSVGGGPGGSSSQQTTAIASVAAFFRANLGNSPSPNFNQNFNPADSPPNVVNAITRVERGFTTSPAEANNLPIADFNGVVGADLCTGGVNPNGCDDHTVTAVEVKINQDSGHHDPNLQAAKIVWGAAGPASIFQIGNIGSRNAAQYQFLDFRTAKALADNNFDQTNFSLQLVDATGALSGEVPLCNYLDLRGPVGGYITKTGDQDYRPILQTGHIPLSAFTGVDLTQITAIRLVFDRTSTGTIYLTNVRFSK